MDLTLDELLDKIRNIFYLSYKEKCDKCKYHLFSKKLKKMDISSDVLKVVLKEIMEDKEYKIYSVEEGKEATIKYFNGDQLAADVWMNKYALKEESQNG